jgi:RNA polymerase sigma factor (sigma-70 family)
MTREDATPEPDALAVLSPRNGPSEAAGEADPLLALVRAAAGGGRDALVRLLSLVAPPISATVRVFLGNQPSDLEDAVQEVLIAVTESLPRFRGESTFLHYCRRIAVRVALAHRRARGRRDAIALSLPTAGDGHVEADTLGLEREKIISAFRRLLDELPAAQAECLAYRVVLEQPLPLIAREIGAPINTVRSRIRLARNYLRERITADPALRELMGKDE